MVDRLVNVGEHSDTEPRAALRRGIKSFVRRQGRMTPAQRRALEESVPGFLVPESPHIIDSASCFSRDAPLSLEIGFGMGQALLERARQRPEWNHIGIDVHQPGLASAARGATELNLTNLRLLEGDAVALLQERFAPGSLQEVQIQFPDPWPKKRHHKRRLIQPAFVELLASRLAYGAELLLVTDWENYAEHMLEVLEAQPQLRNRHGRGRFALSRSERTMTRFEQRGERLGHRIFEMAYERITSAENSASTESRNR